MPARGELTPDQIMVNHLRQWLGKAPLYHKTKDLPHHHWREDCGNYWSREQYCRLAQPHCTRCGGSGLYDGEHLDMRCPCTGLPAKGSRGAGRRPRVRAPYAFQPKGVKHGHQQR